METAELKKQFRIVLFEEEIIIVTPSNNIDGFEAKINLPIDIKIGWHDCIETAETALNYYECCGVLILFGIEPPSFISLCEQLGIDTKQFPQPQTL